MKCRDATCRVTGFSFPHSKRDTSRPYISKQFFNNQSVFCKSNLPTSVLPANALLQRVSGREVLRRHVPSTSRAAPALFIQNRSLGTGLHIVGTGFIARQQAENYHWKQLIADPSSFRLNTKRHGRLHGRSHVRSDGRSDGRLTFV